MLLLLGGAGLAITLTVIVLVCPAKSSPSNVAASILNVIVDKLESVIWVLYLLNTILVRENAISFFKKNKKKEQFTLSFTI